MALEGATRPGDQVFEHSGIKFMMDPYSVSVLGKVQIDYEDGPWGGFAIHSDRLPNSRC